MTEEQKPKVYKSIQEGLLDVAKYGAEIYNQKIKMTDEQIISLVKQYFTEEWCEEDGNGWTEFAGRPDAFVKFAREIRQDGYSEGYDDGWEQANYNNPLQGIFSSNDDPLQGIFSSNDD